MEYERYLLPGQSARSYILGENDLLIQSIEGGIILHEFHGDTLLREKIIDAISAERAAELTPLGEAEGESLPHCFFLANKNSEGFLDAVVAYQGERLQVPFLRIRVHFYAARSV